MAIALLRFREQLGGPRHGDGPPSVQRTLARVASRRQSSFGLDNNSEGRVMAIALLRFRKRLRGPRHGDSPPSVQRTIAKAASWR